MTRNNGAGTNWLMLALCLVLSACVQTAPFRTSGVQAGCSYDLEPCKTAIVEQFLEFDLGYIEFTQRGNIFDRDRSQLVLDFVDQQALSEHGAAVFVFVHGWKHSASGDDTNVIAFREFLSRAAENPFVGKRRVIGIYLGWRGGVTTLPVLKELSYWGRKSVAEEIGSGGATEVLSELQHSLVQQHSAEDLKGDSLYKNTFVVIGHSFGGAIVLTALHDVLLAKLIATFRNAQASKPAQCGKISRFADGIILINPAIEANRVILLREAASKCQFGPEQAELMHVVSSEADRATSQYFPLGQSINLTSTLNPEVLRRTFLGKQVALSERGLDIRTAGNFGPLRTAYLYYDQQTQRWHYDKCAIDAAACGITNKEDLRNHIPIAEHDPLVFLRTDKNFIKDHNDAFSCYVQAYITTVMFDTQSTDRGYQTAALKEMENASQEQNQAVPTIDSSFANCSATHFDFDRCFTNQLYDYGCEHSQ